MLRDIWKSPGYKKNSAREGHQFINFVLLSVLVAGTKTTMFLPSVALVILFKAVLGSPGGAPAEACGSMTPGHGVSAQPSNTFPYTISPSSTNLKQLQPLIDVRISFQLNILRMSSQNLTKFCIDINIDKIWVEI